MAAVRFLKSHRSREWGLLENDSATRQEPGGAFAQGRLLF
jgi:hypothetical protein